MNNEDFEKKIYGDLEKDVAEEVEKMNAEKSFKTSFEKSLIILIAVQTLRQIADNKIIRDLLKRILTESEANGCNLENINDAIRSN